MRILTASEQFAHNMWAIGEELDKHNAKELAQTYGFKGEFNVTQAVMAWEAIEHYYYNNSEVQS